MANIKLRGDAEFEEKLVTRKMEERVGEYVIKKPRLESLTDLYRQRGSFYRFKAKNSIQMH